MNKHKLLLFLFAVFCSACGNELPGPFDHRDVALKFDRFEPAPVRNHGVTPSDDFWLVEGEEVFARWNEYTVKFASGQSCNLCLGGVQVNEDGDDWLIDCPGLNLPSGESARVPERPLVEVWEKPLLGMNGEINEIAYIDYASGCASNPNAAAVFVPSRDAQFMLVPALPSVEVSDVTGDAGAAKLTVHLIHPNVDGQGFPTFKLDAVNDSTWQWFARESNGKWPVNFSNRLQVTKVRVLRGRLVDATFVPSDIANPFVRPYQIRVTYPESGGEAVELQTCPGGSIDNEGFIPIADCRRSRGGLPEFPTPTYTHDLPQDHLIWWIKFHGSQNFPPPVDLDNDEELRIEFILEVKS
jgi:hypothetical protein